MRIALDVEEVIAGTFSYFLSVHNEQHGTAYTMSDVRSWEWVESITELDTFLDILSDGWAHSSDDIPLREPNLTACVRALNDLGTLDIVTASPANSQDIILWLDRHGISEYNDFVHVDPTATKATLNYDYYIDDKPHLTEKLNSDQLQYLIIRPYNTGYHDHSQAVPVETVQTATQKLWAAQRPHRPFRVQDWAVA
jgi:5'(3')-deoxyribonucleotidase